MEKKNTPPEAIRLKTCSDLPTEKIAELSKAVLATHMGPLDGFSPLNETLEPNHNVNAYDNRSFEKDQLNFEEYQALENDGNMIVQAIANLIKQKTKNGDMKIDIFSVNTTRDEIAGTSNWNIPDERACGIATTLYEKDPITKIPKGEPLADSFAICLRENSAILVLGDGCGHGEKPCIASRSAVYACMEYLSKALYREGSKIETTVDIFLCLLRSFHVAHKFVLDRGGACTTLCAAVVCQMKNSDKFIVCSCNIGDSPAYVYSSKHGVREVTEVSHNIYSMRDMRNTLGALGCGSKGDKLKHKKNNLSISMTIVDQGDCVFLTSDGISDNFDPVVAKIAVPRCREEIDRKPCKDHQQCSSSVQYQTSSVLSALPVVEAQERHQLALLQLKDVLNNGLNNKKSYNSAKKLCEVLIDFVKKLTMTKRKIYEDLHGADSIQAKKLYNKLLVAPGKPDHATVVACRVGNYRVRCLKCPNGNACNVRSKILS